MGEIEGEIEIEQPSYTEICKKSTICKWKWDSVGKSRFELRYG